MLVEGDGERERAKFVRRTHTSIILPIFVQHFCFKQRGKPCFQFSFHFILFSVHGYIHPYVHACIRIYIYNIPKIRHGFCVRMHSIYVITARALVHTANRSIHISKMCFVHIDLCSMLQYKNVFSSGSLCVMWSRVNQQK